MRLRYFTLTIVSAVLFALGQPGELFLEGSIVLASLTLAPYLYVVYQQKSGSEANKFAWVFGFVAAFCAHYWLIFFRNFAAWTIGSIAIGYGVVHMILAVVLVRAARLQPRHRVFAVALIWGAYEFLKSIWYLAFPWGISGLAVQDSLAMIQHIDLTGIWSLNFLMVLANALVVEVVIRIADAAGGDAGGRGGGWARFVGRARDVWQACWRPGAVVGLCFAVALGYGWWVLTHPPEVTRNVPLLIVQQNTDPWNEGALAALEANVSLTHDALVRQEAIGSSVRPELVVWSETSIRSPYVENREVFSRIPQERPLATLLAEHDIKLLTGSPYYTYPAVDEDDDEGNGSEVQRVYNGVLLIESDGDVVDYYGKRHLIPFAEHVPLWGVPGARKFLSEVVGLYGSWDPAKRATLFETTLSGGDTLRFGALVCFEDSFGYLARDYPRQGSDLLINLTNNSWSRRESAQVQHLASGRLRAIENRQTLVRSTNSGVSGVIDALGRVDSELPQFTKGAVLVSAPIYDNEPLTLYTRWGDWFGNLLLFAALAVYFITFYRPALVCAGDLRRRRENGGGGAS